MEYLDSEKSADDNKKNRARRWKDLEVEIEEAAKKEAAKKEELKKRLEKVTLLPNPKHAEDDDQAPRRARRHRNR